MNPKLLKAMQPKKKRPVDPNAPPRPTLLGHDKTIRELDAKYQHQLGTLQNQVRALERKLRSQANYLDALHQRISKK